MNRPALILVAVALLAAALTVALWPSGAPEDGLGVVAEATEDEETRSEAPTLEIEDEEEATREEFDPSMLGITDALIVTVIDEFQRPVSDVTVTVAMTSTDELPIWVFEEGVATDSTGSAVFDRTHALEVMAENAWDEVAVGVWDPALRGFRIAETLRLADQTSLTLVLPAEAQIRIRLTGFPAGVMPRITPSDRNRDGEDPLDGVLQPDGSFLIRRPPPRVNWSLSLHSATTNFLTGDPEADRPLGDPIREFAGPVETESVEVDVDFAECAYLQGRLVDENGEAVVLDVTSPGRLRAYGIVTTQRWELQNIDLAFFEGGTFLAWPSDVSRHFSRTNRLVIADANTSKRKISRHELHQLESIYFAWHPSIPDRSMPEVLSPARVAQADLVRSGIGVQLGDLPFLESSTLLKLAIRDVSDEPIPGATVHVQLEVRAPHKPQTSKRSSRILPPELSTISGHTWVALPSWDLVEQTASQGPGYPKDGQVIGYIVTVHKDGYPPAEVQVPLGATEHTITLQSAGSLAGTIQTVLAPGVQLRFLAFDAEDDSADRKPVEEGRTNLTGELQQFSVSNLPTGFVDLELHWHGRDWPIFHQERVEILPGKVTQVPSLQAWAMESKLRWIEVEIPEWMRADAPNIATVRLERPTRESQRTAHGLAYRVDEVYRFPLPVDCLEWDGSIQVGPFPRAAVANLVEGRHQFRWRRTSEITLLSSVSKEDYGKTWRIVIQDATSLGTLDIGDTVRFVEGELRVNLTEPGTYNLRWLRMDDGRFKTVGVVKQTVTMDDLVSGQLGIEPPETW